jgi:hypothetical protein
LTFYSHLENAYLTAAFSVRGKVRVIKLVFFLLMCVYQTSKVSGHVYRCARGVDIVPSQ